MAKKKTAKKKKARKKYAKARRHKKAAPGNPNKTYRKKDVRHKPNGEFAAGNCANPYGRPKGALSVKNAWARSLSRLVKKGMTKTKLDEIIDSLVDQALRQAYKDRLTMMKESGDRIDGKPAQTVHTPDLRGDPWDELSEEELLAIAAAKTVEDTEDEET